MNHRNWKKLMMRNVRTHRGNRIQKQKRRFYQHRMAPVWSDMIGLQQSHRVSAYHSPGEWTSSSIVDGLIKVTY